MADFIPLRDRVCRVQLPSDEIADPRNSLVDQAQYHGWLLRSITGFGISIPERGPEPLEKFPSMPKVARSVLKDFLDRMIAIKAPISLHWHEATGEDPMQAAQTKTAMDRLLSFGAHFGHNELLYELIMAYGRAGYISPRQATNGVTALEEALRARNHTTVRALVELGATTENIPSADLRAAQGISCKAGNFDFFMEHWVKHGSAIHQTYMAACMSREIMVGRDVAAVEPVRTDAVVAAAPGGRRRGI